MTADVDLVIDLSTDTTADTVRALTASGYRSMAPVDPMALADPAQRADWQTTRGMKVFSFWDSTNTPHHRHHPRPDRELFPTCAGASVVTMGGTAVQWPRSRTSSR
ncbi:MAG: hypothetical protein IPF50_15845 [Proteobacteria bacterium]|nr:hypothetical protein [Pseudomonadota bacterium]